MKRIHYALFIILLQACSTKPIKSLSTMEHAFRLKPGDDLKKSITQYVTINNIKAGWIATCVGSLTTYAIRFANQPAATTSKGYFEIISLTGTLSSSGSHIHISIADTSGKTIGGHLADGCIIYTTAEIVIQQSSKYVFTREKDGTTEWEELQIKKQ